MKKISPFQFKTIQYRNKVISLTKATVLIMQKATRLIIQKIHLTYQIKNLKKTSQADIKHIKLLNTIANHNKTSLSLKILSIESNMKTLKVKINLIRKNIKIIQNLNNVLKTQIIKINHQTKISSKLQILKSKLKSSNSIKKSIVLTLRIKGKKLLKA